MDKFMLIFHHDTTGPAPQDVLSPEQMQAEIEKWAKWAQGLAAEGRLIESYGLHNTGRTIRGKQRVITDGPYTEGKEIIVSFTILYAHDLEDATQYALSSPTNEFLGGIVEVRHLHNFGNEPSATSAD